MANGTQTKTVNAPAPPPPQRTLTRSVQQPPVSLEAGPGGGNSFVLWMASIADTFQPWGKDVVRRDRELRDFWPTESFLAGAVYTCAISNSSLEWELDGPDQTVEAVHDLINQADLGRGWREFAIKVSLDLYTQDNGVFIEIIRQSNSASAPILGISHLDTARCQRTGDLQFPVIYTDTKGIRHKMPWHSVIALTEFPSPINSMYGVQYSAVTRVLRSAQVLRDMAIYRGEKAGGRFAEAIHILGGVKTQDIIDIKERAGMQADNQGLVRYLQPIIVGSLDPGSTPTVATLDLKSLPEGFDFDKELKWYISSLALGFGRDYQDFAPLSSGNLGTASQSEVLHMKSRGKGPAAFMRMIEQAFNFHGVMPRTVTFRFQEQDIEAEGEEALVKKTRAETRKIQISSLEISPIIARQIAADDGDLKPEYLEAMGEGDVTPGETVEGTEKPAQETASATVGAIMLPAEPELPTEEKMIRSTLANFTRVLTKNPQFKERNPDVMLLLEQAAKEASVDVKLDKLTQIVTQLQETGFQLVVDEALSETDQTLDAMRNDLKANAAALEERIAEIVGSFERENETRRKAITSAVSGLTVALQRMEKSQRDRKSVAAVASELRGEIESGVLDFELVEQSVIERDDQNRVSKIRRRYASGRAQEFKVIRDSKGFFKKLKEINRV